MQDLICCKTDDAAREIYQACNYQLNRREVYRTVMRMHIRKLIEDLGPFASPYFPTILNYRSRFFTDGAPTEWPFSETAIPELERTIGKICEV